MSVLFLHIGSHKTGTSALQSAFAINAARLKESGIIYPGADADARQNRITSGNGLRLASYLNRDLPFHFRHDNFLRNFDRVLAKAGGKHVLYSSEFLEAFEPARLKEFLAHAVAQGYDCRLVYFVRSIAGHAISSYSQAVKREKVTDSFDVYLRGTYQNPFRNTIERGDQTVGRDNVLLLNYDAIRKDLLPAFLQTALHLDPKGFQPPPTVNRSLTVAEIEVMRVINARLTDRRRAVRISDALIYANPNAETGFIIRADEVRILKELHAGGLDFVNSRLAGETISICDPSIKQGERPKLTPAELDKAVLKALGLVPETEKTAETGA